MGPLNRFKPQVFYITDRSKAVLKTWFYVLLVLLSNSVLFSPFLCLDDFKLGLGGCLLGESCSFLQPYVLFEI